MVGDADRPSRGHQWNGPGERGVDAGYVVTSFRWICHGGRCPEPAVRAGSEMIQCGPARLT